MRQLTRRSVELTLLLIRIGIVLLLIVVGWTVYKLLFESIVRGNYIIFSVLGLWVITAYLVLPRLHRLLTKLYVPDYFVGRVRTGDGLLGDVVNLAVIGDEQALRKAMKKAGWIEAEPLTWHSTLKIIKATLLKRSYPAAPVSSLYLFSNKQSLAFQKEINNNPRARHHVRFWRVPRGWYLPGGHEADYMGAASYDIRVKLSFFTLQFTHKVDQDIDKERNFVVDSVLEGNPKAKLDKVPHFMTAYRHRNGGGDSIQTDGALYFLHLN